MKLSETQKGFLNKVCRGTWTLNVKGEVDVDGWVYMNNMNLKEIPVRFGKVDSSFNCSYNQLTSLEFCPSEVGGRFNCSHNQLTSLKFCASKVSGDFYCHNNQLTSLKFCPSEVGEDFSCSNNQLTSLEFCPSEVGGSFYCWDNQLTSLKFCPSEVGGVFYCQNNRLTDYFKNIKEEDFHHWGELDWHDILKEYSFLVNIGKKYIKDLKKYLNEYPLTKLYLE